MGEKADVTGPRKLLRRAAGRALGGVVLFGRIGDWADRIEVVSYQRFIRDEDEEGKLFEDGDLGNAIR